MSSSPDPVDPSAVGVSPERIAAIRQRQTSGMPWSVPHNALQDAADIRDLLAALDQQQARVEALEQEIAKAMAVLDPNVPESGLEDAARQVKQVAISAMDNCEKGEALLVKAEAERDTLTARLARVEALIKSADLPWRIVTNYPMFVGTGVAVQNAKEIAHQAQNPEDVFGLYIGRQSDKAVVERWTAVVQLVNELREALASVSPPPSGGVK